MSEGNTAHMDGDLRCCLERVKMKDTVLQAHFTKLTTNLEVIPLAEEQVRKISNKVPVEKEVLNDVMGRRLCLYECHGQQAFRRSEWKF